MCIRRMAFFSDGTFMFLVCYFVICSEFYKEAIECEEEKY
jgi:hypothetical protein